MITVASRHAPVDSCTVHRRCSSPPTATRIRMITYYLDIATDPARPRLVRRHQQRPPDDLRQRLGTVVAFDVEPSDQLRPRASTPDGVGAITDVRMNDDDLRGTAPASRGLLAEPDSQDQRDDHRPVAATPMRQTRQYFRATR